MMMIIINASITSSSDYKKQQRHHDFSLSISALSFAAIALLVNFQGLHAFWLVPRLQSPHRNVIHSMDDTRWWANSIILSSTRNDDDTLDDRKNIIADQNSKKFRINKKKEPLTAGDIRRELLRNPAPFFDAIQEANAAKKKSKSRRTRKRVDQPQQQYLYASQRLKMQQQPGSTTSGNSATDTDDDDDDDTNIDRKTTDPPIIAPLQTKKKNIDLAVAKEYGMIPSTQHCDPVISSHEVPKIVASLRVSTNSGSDRNDNGDNDDVEGGGIKTTTTTTMMAYIIEKPAGWSILGGKTSSSPPTKLNDERPEVVSSDDDDDDTTSTPGNDAPTPMERRNKFQKRISAKNEDGSFGGYMEYNELDVLALMTPEELLEEYENNEALSSEQKETLAQMMQSSSSSSLKSSMASSSSNPKNNDRDDTATVSILDTSNEDSDTTNIDPQTLANLRRIQARSTSTEDDVSKSAASFASVTRPSVITWLKDIKAAAGTPIRGGNYWTALAGAVDVDDTGLVLLCPKANVNNVCIEYVEYMAVVGNGNQLDPNPGKSKSDPTKKHLSFEPAVVESMAKLRRGRGEDIVETVKITIPEVPSTCSNVIRICQDEYHDGIRGDPSSSPFDRRAQRRLIHCNAMSVSSQTFDDTIEIETDGLPDDIAVLSERRNHLEYKNGSFLGRLTLRNNPLTTAYREINGAADGFPGWTVDRYGQYLLVYHDTKYPKGPLPSIHDGNTIGVYYLESNPNRSSMGSETDARPRLLEGRPAPDIFPILENGVTYLVSLDRDLSTGIFLDQRLHRAWLHRNCNPNTRVLNCFAHTGAFSVAAASAGASTVSLDLSKKWLDRLPDQLLANGVEFDERHDCIYGDCFDWLVRLAKRKELYDVVILDPPSTSIGQKRKRWSIQDMDELVALAVPLVKKGGFLWTTTNSGSIPITKFVRLCRKGFEDAGVPNAKLERIQPMPTDFPCVGPQPVKNLVWRIP